MILRDPTKSGLGCRKAEPQFSLTPISTWLGNIMTPLEPMASWEAMLSELQNFMTLLNPDLRYWFIPNFVIQNSDIDIRARLSVFENTIYDPMTQGMYVADHSAAHSFCILMEIPMQRGWIENREKKQYHRSGLLSGYRIIFDYEHVNSK